MKNKISAKEKKINPKMEKEKQEICKECNKEPCVCEKDSDCGCCCCK